MSTNNSLLYRRCTQCKLKPGTLSCYECNIDFCLQCEHTQHSHLGHQIKVESSPLKESKVLTLASQNTDHLDLKFKLKAEDQANRILMMNQQQQRLEQQYSENLEQLRQEKIQLQQTLIIQKTSFDLESRAMRLEFECKLEQQLVQLEQLRDSNDELQLKLTEQEKAYNDRIASLKRELQVYHDKFDVAEQNHRDIEQNLERSLNSKNQQLLNEVEKTKQKEFDRIKQDTEKHLIQKLEVINSLNLQVKILQQSLQQRYRIIYSVRIRCERGVRYFQIKTQVTIRG